VCSCSGAEFLTTVEDVKEALVIELEAYKLEEKDELETAPHPDWLAAEQLDAYLAAQAAAAAPQPREPVQPDSIINPQPLGEAESASAERFADLQAAEQQLSQAEEQQLSQGPPSGQQKALTIMVAARLVDVSTSCNVLKASAAGHMRTAAAAGLQ
jgi:hypothetical protein